VAPPNSLVPSSRNGTTTQFRPLRASFGEYPTGFLTDKVTVEHGRRVSPLSQRSVAGVSVHLPARGDEIRMQQTSSSFRPDLQGSDGSISLSEIISALSYALDLTEGAVQGHALRSCLLGMRIAAEAQLPSDHASSLYFALLLKDIGCSSNASRMCEIVGEDDSAVRYRRWSNPQRAKLELPGDSVMPEFCIAKSGMAAKFGIATRMTRVFYPGRSSYKNVERAIRSYSDRGAGIVAKLGMGESAAQAVRRVDERWDGSGKPDSMRGEQIPLLSRICAIAQHLDVFSAGRGAEGAIDTLQHRSGTWFDPQFVRVAVSLHRRRALLANCSATDSHDDTRQAVLDLGQGSQRLRSSQIDQICEAFADVVDAKSHFTFRHSLGVADAALGIAQGLGLAPDRAQLVRRAALLHDIGKLSVPNSILDKQGGLSVDDWKAVHLHPIVTRDILERVGPFREMGVIAGEHHEKLDGSGYPNRLMAADLSVESRIIAVADVYAALSEDRPYRPGLEADQVISIMKSLTPYKLDQDCVRALVSFASRRRDLTFTPPRPTTDPRLAYAI
jgi:putative nucleotidyltransferase with HDIG domain